MFFKFDDMRKVFESANTIGYLEEKRNDKIKPTLETIPGPFDIIQEFPLGLDRKILEKLVEKRLMSAENIVLFEKYLFKACLKDETIFEDVQKLATKVILRMSNDMTTDREYIAQRSDLREKSIKSAIIRNEQLIRKNKTNSREFVNVIKKQKELLEIRKQKFIRSMNKALEIAKHPANLDTVDSFVYNLIDSYDWVGFDGSMYCCKENNIMFASTTQVEEIFKIITNYVRNK
jgi:hypothetical protein